MNKYEKGNITFKGLNIYWNLYTTEKSEHGVCEVFNIVVEEDKKHKQSFREYYKNKKEIRFDFTNSIVEYELSKLNIGWVPLREIKKKLLRKYSWGGYDEVKNRKEFREERVKNLLYSILNCMANDSITVCLTFKDFCDAFGYEDSIKHKKIYHKVLDQYDKLNSLNINWSDWEYIAQEEEQFPLELDKALKGECFRKLNVKRTIIPSLYE